MNDDEFRAHLEANLYLHIRKLPDGWVGVMPLLFASAL